jgi:TonB family protein
MAMITDSVYRRPLFDPNDVLFMRCLTTCAIVGVLLVIAVQLIPAPPPKAVVKVDELPQRFAKLILEPVKKAPPPVLPAGDQVRAAKKEPGGGGGGGGPAAQVEPVHKPAPAPGAPAGNRQVETMHSLSTGSGAAGRARAQAEVGAQIASSSKALSSALAGLTSSLGVTSSASGGSVARGGRARGIRDASGAADLGHVSATLGGGGIGAGAGGDLSGSALKGSLVSIGELAAALGSGGGSGGGIGTGTGSGVGPGTGPGSGGGSGGGTGGGYGSGTGAGAGPGVYRSNASLLAVIQRYAAGIQYCYGNELKRDPTLRGKLVVALTVAASGEVTEATVVQNTTGSHQLASCALSQIRDWRFPPVPVGATTFQAPFVFTPPN